MFFTKFISLVQRLQMLLSIPEDDRSPNSSRLNRWLYSWKFFILLTIISYLFAIAIRFIWVEQVKANPSFYWNDEIMISTNDGYYFAQGAKDYIKGEKLYPASPSELLISKVTAFLSETLPFSFETIILYMPAFFGSFIVIPIMLIGRALNITYVAFIASLIGGIARSYYNRTMVGYYDSDMLVVVLPTLVIALIIFAMCLKEMRYIWRLSIIFILPLLMTASMEWYGNAYIFFTAFLCAVIFYTVVFERHRLFNYQLLILFMLGMLRFSYSTTAIVALLLCLGFYLMSQKVDEKMRLNILWGLSGALFLYILSQGVFRDIFYQVSSYVFRKVFADEAINLSFYGVLQTVREAAQIPFELFAARISGDKPLFYISTLGIVMMMIRYPVLIVTLPLVAAGFIAMKGGLRFTVYTVPINALGLGYVLFLSAYYLVFLIQKISGFNPSFQALFNTSKYADYIQRGVKVAFILPLLYLSLAPHITHIKAYQVPTVFNNTEVQILDRLGEVSQEKDYVISWWDYGYPIRYYAEAQTLIDGGRHDGAANYPVSFSLSKPMTPSVNMLRLSVEDEESNIINPRAGSSLLRMLQDYNYTNPENFITALDDKDFKLPEKTRDIYLYLPYRLLEIFPTVMLFSSIDTLNGQSTQSPFFFHSQGFTKEPDGLVLRQGIKLYTKDGQITGKIKYGQNILSIKYFIRTFYSGQKLEKIGTLIDKDSSLNVIYMQNYKSFLLLDDRAFYSTFVQLYILEDYDKDLFEPVILNPYAKVYRLKK